MHVLGGRSVCRHDQAKSALIPAILILAAPWAARATHHDSPYEEAPYHEAPYRVEVGYIGERWSVLQGGLERGSRYLDNLDLILTADLEHTFNVPVTLHAHALSVLAKTESVSAPAAAGPRLGGRRAPVRVWGPGNGPCLVPCPRSGHARGGRP